MEESRSLVYSIVFQSNAEQAEPGLQNIVNILRSLQHAVGDFNDLQSDVRSTLGGLGNLQSEADDTVGSLDDLQDAADDAADSLGDLQDEADDVTDTLGDLQDETDDVSGGLGDLQTEASSMGSAFRKSFLSSVDSGNTFASSLRQGVGGALTYIGDRASDFRENFSKTASNIGNSLAHPIQTIKNGLGNALQSVRNRFINMARGAEEAEEETEDLGETADDAEKDIKDIGDTAEQSGGKFEKFGSVIKGVGVALAAATTAVGAIAASSVNAGMTFDSSMSQVAATMGYTVEELNTAGSEASETYNELREFAMEMGATTAFSASQAADALNYMALAGYDADTSMVMLPNVLNLAAAGGMELATASDMVTDAQSALGLSMDETTELVDKMAKTASKSNTSVAQMGEAILTIGGTAKNLAGGTTELGTALGILADNGVKGVEGGTALRNIVLSLSAPTDVAAKAMKKLGLEVFDAEGNMRPLNETFGDLNDALSTMTQEQQTQALNDIFNKVDLKSVNALLANTGKRFDELSGYIDNAAGAAEAMAQVQLDNLDGDITMFKSALEGAQILVSDELTPTLREFVQFGTNSLSTLSAAFKEGGLSGAMSALGTILSDGLGMVIDKLPAMIDAGMQLLSALGQGLLDNMPLIVDAAIQIITSLGDGILKALPKVAEAAVTIITTLANGIGDSLPTLIPTIVETILQVASTLIENLPVIIDAGMQIIDGLAQGVSDAIPLLIEQLPELINRFAEFITNNLPTIVEQGIQIIMTLTDAIISAVPMLIEQLPTLIIAVVDFITASLPTIIEQGIQLILNLAMGIIDAIPILLEHLPEIISSIVGFLVDNLPLLVEAGINLIVQLAVGIIQAIPQLVAALPEIIGAIVGGLGELPGMLLDIGVSLVKGLWDGICQMGEWLWNQVSGFFGGIVDGIKGFLGIHSPSKVFADIGDNMALGIGEGFADEMDSVTKNMEGAIPTSFDLPEVNTPDVSYGTIMPPKVEDSVANESYYVSPVVESAKTPTMADVNYNVAPVVESAEVPAVADVNYGVKAVVEESSVPAVSDISYDVKPDVENAEIPTVADVSYGVIPVVESAETPSVADVSYGVAPVIESAEAPTMADVEDITYGVKAVVEDIKAPTISDTTYGVKAVVEEFTPPDVSASAVYDNVTGTADETVERKADSAETAASPVEAPAFSPVININVSGDMSEEGIGSISKSLRETVRQLYIEFRTEELERMALKQQYAF